MRAVLRNTLGEVVVGEIDDAAVRDSTDAVARMIVAGICGTDVRAFAVVGDGAVGLCGVLTARGTEAAAQVLAATGGAGADLVVDAVGEQDALDTAVALCADGGALSVVGGPHGGIDLTTCFLRNITVSGGLTPVGATFPNFSSRCSRLDPSPIFEATVPLAVSARGCQLMATRHTTKVSLRL
ncbi:zinc-binding dehydrogenase [Nocardia alni]|uniref:zinc-binding dehydrogenase n=1 Tax=Nocardia alni TaxID=2815723 RepID=UPI001C2113DA|nr:zinc-binding dehydrogenase [Nocardia alni]